MRKPHCGNCKLLYETPYESIYWACGDRIFRSRTSSDSYLMYKPYDKDFTIYVWYPDGQISIWEKGYYTYTVNTQRAVDLFFARDTRYFQINVSLVIV